MDLELTPGTFIRRYKRFFADVVLDGGETVISHCPNTGSMKTLLAEGATAWIKPATDPKRKLRWTLTLLEVDGGLALVDTALPNRIVETAVDSGAIPELANYGSLRREVTYGDRSRIDLLLDDPAPCYIEIKNVTMASQTVRGRADFPDSVTDRGKKHLGELAKLAREGVRCVQFFLVSRTDCDRCGIAAEIDPEYARALEDAVEAGVEILAYRAEVTPERLSAGTRCPFDMP